MASRVKNSRSRAARLLIDGTDPDEVMVLQKEVPPPNSSHSSFSPLTFPYFLVASLSGKQGK
jgi:hypothetical protein